jgi:hypothetical protein
MVNSYSVVHEETGIHQNRELSNGGREHFYRSFYSNYSNQFYAIFAIQLPGWGRWGLMYSRSGDGVGWTNTSSFPNVFPSVGVLGWGLSLDKEMDFYLTPDGRYIYWAGEESTNTQHLWWGKVGINQATGDLYSIVNATEILTGQYQAGGDPVWGTKQIEDEYSIVVDRESYVYIGMEVEFGVASKTYIVIKSNAPDSFTYENFGDSWSIETEYINNGGANPANDKMNGQLFPLHNYEDVGIVWGYFENAVTQELHRSLYYDNSTDDWIDLTNLLFNDNEAGDWADDSWGLGWSSDLTVLFKQHESNPDGVIELDAMFLDQTTDSWVNTTQISFDIAGDAGSERFFPLVSVREGSNAVNFIWGLNGNDTIWYRRMFPNSTFEDIQVLESTLDNNVIWTYFSGGHTGLGPMGVTWLVNEGSIPEYPDQGDFILHNYVTFLEDDWIVPYAHLNTTLYNEDGTVNDGWMFEGDIYTFDSYFHGADNFHLNFTDGQHDIYFRFDGNTNYTYIETDEGFVIGEIFSNYTIYPDGTQRVIWRFVPDINIVDIVNTTVYYRIYNATLNTETYASIAIWFNIYNLGGLTYYIFEGDGGRTPYGSAFDLYATDGNQSSSATAEQIFRKLQHINFLIEINMGNEWDAGTGDYDIDAGVGYVDIGIDYRLNASWVEGFKIRLYVFDAEVGHHLGGNDQDWVLWSVDFYNYLPATGTQQNLQTAYIYSNHWGYERRNFTPDRYDNRTACQLWVDLWFDKTNASTTVASQTNAYYRGMKEQGSAWWFGYGVFTPMIGDYDNAKFLDNLYDEEGNITNVQKYDLMKFYITVGKVNDTDGNDEMWRISAVEDMHRELAIDRMEGIDEPTFVETKIIDMPQTGFINAIKSAISNLSKLIWAGAFQFIKLLMGAIGTLMDAIGLGEWWIAFNAILGSLADYSIILMDEVLIALSNSALLLTQVFNLLSAGIGRFVYGLTSSITGLLSWYGYIVEMFTGTGSIWSADLWMSLSLEDWFVLGFHLLPVWWVNRLAQADNLGETLKSDLMFASWLITGLFNLFVTIIMLSVAILNLIIGLLPI